MAITTDIAASDQRAAVKAKFESLLDYYYGSGEYTLTQWGNARTLLNSLKASTQVYAGDAAANVVADFNLLNNLPDNANLNLNFTADTYVAQDAVTTFDDALTHYREKNATMVDSDGLLKWAPHNLLTYSEDFSNGWQSIGTTEALVTDATSPLETTLVSEITITAGTLRQVRQDGGAQNGQRITFKVWGKAGTHPYVSLALQSVTASTGQRVIVNLSNGAFIQEPTSPVSCNVESAGSGWYLITASGVVTNDAAFDISISPVDASGGNLTATGAETFFLTGAHLYRSDLGGMVDNPDRGDSYVPTTTAARYLPRRNNHVYNGTAWANEGILHESEARTNLEDYSDMSSGTTLVNSATLTPNNSLGPAGANTAATLTTANATSQQGVATTQASSGSTNHTFSIFAKANGVNYIQLIASSIAFGVDVWGNFDLATGVAGTMGTAVLNHGIEDWGGGWYRVFITGLANGSSGGGGAYMVNAATTTRAGAVTGDGTSGLLLFGYQLEEGSTPSSYIPTSGSTATRAADTLTIPAINARAADEFGPELVTGAWSGTGNTQDGVTFTGDNLEYWGSSFPTVVGKVYRVLGSMSNKTNNSQLRVRNGAVGLGSPILSTNNDSLDVSVDYVFVATTTTHNVEVLFRSDAASVDLTVSVKEITRPSALTIQMDGTMTYADTNTVTEVGFYNWYLNTSNHIRTTLYTSGSRTGQVFFEQRETVSGGEDLFSPSTAYSPGINVPFNIASRHGSTFINGAVDGVALTANTTPVALPDLTATNIDLGYDYMGNIGAFRLWSGADFKDNGIAEISSPSLEPSLSLTFDGSEGSFTVLDWSE